MRDGHPGGWASRIPATERTAQPLGIGSLHGQLARESSDNVAVLMKAQVRASSQNKLPTLYSCGNSRSQYTLAHRSPAANIRERTTSEQRDSAGVGHLITYNVTFASRNPRLSSQMLRQDASGSALETGKVIVSRSPAIFFLTALNRAIIFSERGFSLGTFANDSD